MSWDSNAVQVGIVYVDNTLLCCYEFMQFAVKVRIQYKASNFIAWCANCCIEGVFQPPVWRPYSQCESGSAMDSEHRNLTVFIACIRK